MWDGDSPTEKSPRFRRGRVRVGVGERHPVVADETAEPVAVSTSVRFWSAPQVAIMLALRLQRTGDNNKAR